MTVVDVLLPVRNGADHLAEAMRSILDQDHRALRLIVLDDGSSDDSLAIARAMAAADDRVEVHALDQVGLPGALNVGLQYVTSPWIARMDADDVSLPSRLARQLAFVARRREVVGWATWARAMTKDGRVTTLMPRGPQTVTEFTASHARGPLDVNGATVLLRADVVREAGGWDPEFDFAEDVELYDRMGEIGPILTIPEPLYLVRIHEASHWMEGLDRSLVISRYLRARKQIAQSAKPLTLQRFINEHERTGLLHRWFRRRERVARRCHHRATMRVMERRRLAAVGWTLPVLMLAPRFLLQRVARMAARRRAATP